MQLVDIGANLCSHRFNKDLDSVIERSFNECVAHIVVTGTSVENSEASLALASKHSKLSSTAGVHPHHADSWCVESKAKIRDLAQNPKVSAVGECGLDFNRNFSAPKAQVECFEQQLKLAVELGKPVFLHERDAHEKFIEILRNYQQALKASVVHCFTGTRDQLEAYLDLGCHIGITGWVCDTDRGQALRDVVASIPSDRLMIETDAPFLTPKNMPKRPKDRRNEPAFLSYVLAELAQLRGQEVESLAIQTTQVAAKFFDLALDTSV